MPILKEAVEVQTRLEQLGLTVSEIVEIARAAVGGRRSATLDHPATAPGTLSWIEGTAAMRRLLCAHGWSRSRDAGIESVYNAEANVRIAFQNADRAGDEHADPIASSDKGPASAQYVASNQGWLFPEMAAMEERLTSAACYYLFVHAHGDEMRIELSFPQAVEAREFAGFHERIIIVPPDDSVGFIADDEPGPDFEVDVTRKAG